MAGTGPKRRPKAARWARRPVSAGVAPERNYVVKLGFAPTSGGLKENWERAR